MRPEFKVGDLVRVYTRPPNKNNFYQTCELALFIETIQPRFGRDNPDYCKALFVKTNKVERVYLYDIEKSRNFLTSIPK